MYLHAWLQGHVLAWLQGLGNKTKGMYYSFLSLKMISFVLFPQASLPSLNFNTMYMCIEIGQLLSSA